MSDGAAWPEVRLSWVADTLVPQRDKPTELDGPIPWLRIEDFDGKYLGTSKSGQGVTSLQVAEMSLRVFPENTVICSCSCTMGATAIASKPLITNQTFIGLVPAEQVLPDFLYYLLQARQDELQAQASGAIQQYLSKDQFRSLRFLLPPIDEQRRIADFLDDQTTRIDQIINARQLQIRMSEESKRSFADEVAFASLQDSPRRRLRWLVEEVDQRAGAAASGAELLSVSIHRGVVPRSELTDDLHRADSLENYKRVQAGDLVLNRMRAFQGGVGVARAHGIVSPDYAVLRCETGYLPEFAHFIFRSSWFVGEMITRLRGIGSVELGNARTPRINVADLLDIEVPIPTIEEQRQRMTRLQTHMNSVDQALTLLDRQSSLLREFKRSLISAAVSGELDVSAASGRGVQG